MSLNNLPIRAAVATRRPPPPPPPPQPQPQQETLTTPDTNQSLIVGAGDDSLTLPSIDAEDAVEIASLSPEHVRLDAATAAAEGPNNHQFWLKDAKIAEDLFTIHRSAKHLAEFTAAILGNRDPSLGYQPIPVMSDSDILFMTQLSNDISRSVGGISAVRYHGLRTKKRKIRSNGIGARSSKKEEKSSPHVGTSKRTQKTEDEAISCSKCGRTETPEWRRGPDGLLCNVCGLVYAKQRRKLKSG